MIKNIISIINALTIFYFAIHLKNDTVKKTISMSEQQCTFQDDYWICEKDEPQTIFPFHINTSPALVQKLQLCVWILEVLSFHMTGLDYSHSETWAMSSCLA